MRWDEYSQFDAIGIVEVIRRREVALNEVADAAIAAIEALNPSLNAVVQTFPDIARRGEYAKVSEGPLSGVPFLVKDLGVLETGVAHHMGSRLGQGFVASHDSQLAVRFRSAGLVTLGRTNTPEFGFNVSTEPVVNGATCNPWQLSRTAGGSSGGSAAAVASGMVPFAHATDAGGSIRIPASCCGLFGLKPTRGRVSHGPQVGDALNGLSVQLGLSRSVRDTAALLDISHGSSVGDPFQIPEPKKSYLEEVSRPPGQLRIAFTKTPWSGASVDSDAESGLEETAVLCSELGHRVTEASPSFDYPSYFSAVSKVWSANLRARVDSLSSYTGKVPSEEFLEATVWTAYRYAETIGAADFVQALGVFNIVTREVSQFFEDYDVLLTPTTVGEAPMLGIYNADDESIDLLGWLEKIFSFAPFTALFNLTGQPAMSVPLCMSRNGLPIGMHFVSRYGSEATLIRLASQLENARPWGHLRPSVLENTIHDKS